MEICVQIEDEIYERFEYYLAIKNITIKKFINDAIDRCLEENKEECEQIDEECEEEDNGKKEIEFETLGKYLAEGDGITEKKRTRIKELLKVFYRSLKIYCETKDQNYSYLSSALSGGRTCSNEFWGKLASDSGYFAFFENSDDSEEKKGLKKLLRKQLKPFQIDQSILED